MIRIVVGQVGYDGPGSADSVVTAAGRALRDAGHEVVHVGTQQAADQVAGTAIQEDADVVALWVGDRADTDLLTGVVAHLGERQACDVAVLVVGAGPDDGRSLAAGGVAAAFPAGTPASEVVRWVAAHLGAGPA